MYKDDKIIGCVLISGDRYILYDIIVCGRHREYKLLADKSIHVSTRTRKGGQSQTRYQNINDEMHRVHINKTAEIMVRYFRDTNKLIIAGPARSKNELISCDIYKKYFSKHEVTSMTTDGINDRTIKHIMQNVSISNSESDNKMIRSLIDNIEINPDKYVFGKEVIDHLKDNMLEYVIMPPDDDNDYDYETNAKIFINSDHIGIYDMVIGVKYY